MPRRLSAFTLVEVLVVLAVVGVLAGLATSFHTGPSAAEEAAFLSAGTTAVRTLPGLARIKGQTLTLALQDQRLVTRGPDGVVTDGPSVPVPQDAKVASSLQVSPDTVTGSLELTVGRTCTRITPVLYGAAEPVNC